MCVHAFSSSGERKPQLGSHRGSKILEFYWMLLVSPEVQRPQLPWCGESGKFMPRENAEKVSPLPHLLSVKASGVISI